MLNGFITLAPPTDRPYAGPERRNATAPITRWLARMLDEMDHGMLLITPSGSPRHVNEPARRELMRSDALRQQQGHIAPAHGDQQGLFAQALADAGRGRRRLVTLGANGHALSVAVVPMGADGQGDEPLVLLVLGKRQSCEVLTVDFFARTQGLTAAEARVLQALCDGSRPKEIAREFGVAVSTIRTQISSIRNKTLTTSIRDLVNRVTTLPPLTPAMKSMLTH